MKQIENLWPEDLGVITIAMPKEILVQQAKYLADMTKNVIFAEVKSSQGILQGTDEKILLHEFVVKAPSLGNYKFTLIKAAHDLSIYPIHVVNCLTEEVYDAHDEEEFIRSVGQIFNSMATKNAINAIVAQSL